MLHFLHARLADRSRSFPDTIPSAMPVCRLQTKEVTRLNHVYLKLLRDAGVEVIGEPLTLLEITCRPASLQVVVCKAFL